MNPMRHIILSELRKQLEDQGIPQFAEELRRRLGYNERTRKLRKNPEEQALIDAIQARRGKHGV